MPIGVEAQAYAQCREVRLFFWHQLHPEQPSHKGQKPDHVQRAVTVSAGQNQLSVSVVKLSAISRGSLFLGMPGRQCNTELLSQGSVGSTGPGTCLGPVASA